MESIELAAAILGLICVALGVVRSMWNFAFGIASVGLLGIVFFRTRLYSDALLQLFFVAVNAYGWWNWRRTRADTGTVLVERMDARAIGRWALGGGVAVALWGGAMHRYTDASYPWPDAAIAITSVVAQVLMAQRKLENWILWIAVDLASIPLYAAKALSVTMMLYTAYLALAIWGLVDWHRVRRATGPAVA